LQVLALYYGQINDDDDDDYDDYDDYDDDDDYDIVMSSALHLVHRAVMYCDRIIHSCT